MFRKGSRAAERGSGGGSGAHGPGSREAAVPPPAARAQLERILASSTFRNADRLSRLLRFTVEQALADAGNPPKEYVIALEVFDRPPSFDPRFDSVVRVEARRLRYKLRDYYEGEGRDDPILIDLPKGSYLAVFQPRVAPEAHQVVPEASHRRRLLLLGAGGAGLALAGTLLFVVITNPRPRMPAVTTVAVLPFENLTGTSEAEYLSLGLADELITALAKVNGLRVVARTSAFQLRGKRASAVGHQLNAGAVLEGSVRSSGNALRITARLVAAADESCLWSETYERDAKDLFSLPRQIARAVTATLQLPLVSGRSQWTVPQPAADPDALRLYWKGRYFRKQPGPEGLRKSVEYYQQALLRDPGYAPAHAALAEAYATMGFHRLAPPAELIPKAKASAQKALDSDNALAEPHAVLAWIRFFHDWDWPAAERGFRRALELDPSHAKTHTWYALGLISQGRYEEAIAESRVAQELDPLAYAVASDLGVVLYAARRYDETVRWAQRALAANPKFTPARVLLGLCYVAEGRYQEAISEYRKALESSERYSYVLAALGYACALSGRPEEARRLLREIKNTTPGEDPYYAHIAVIYAGLGDKDGAFESLERAFRRREADLLFIRVERAFDSLRGDPRFASLLERVGLEKPSERR